MSSLQERAQARRQKLQQTRYCELPLPGYEDMFAVRYRILGREELKPINRKNTDTLSDPDELEIANYADTLIEACEELLEVKGPKEFASTGKGWNAQTVREFFAPDLSEGASAREALFAVFPPTQSELVAHYLDYDAHLLTTSDEIEREMVGELKPSPVEG